MTTEITKEELFGMTEVTGTYSGHDDNLIIEWTCPTTGKQLTCQGQFEDDGDAYYHDVFDEDDNFLYTVIATDRSA